MSAVGIDACRGGWVAVILKPGRPPRALFAESLDGVSASVGHAEGFAVDIPIGLVGGGARTADEAARAFLGPRWQSVFLTPVAEALTAETHTEASAISRRLTGKGISQQAFALAPKILEAARWSHAMTVPVWEVHPEVSFALLLGRPASAPKKTWAGMRERWEALSREGIVLDGLGEAGRRAAVDDVLDAAAAAWSAERLRRGQGRCFPDPPDQYDLTTGSPIAIWA